MENVTVKIDKKDLMELVGKTNFNLEGMFIPYQFIAISFDKDENNTGVFYESIQANSNSWVNYPGVKIWDNSLRSSHEDDEILEQIEDSLSNYLNEYSSFFPNVTFKLINF